MPTYTIHSIPYKDTGYFSKLICSYLDEDKKLKPFYHHFPRLKDFQAQIQEKQQDFNHQNRRHLAKRIMYQYGDNSISQSTLSNIGLLKENTTFTITTGHQLNLFTGPLYFLYKILSAINLCEQLRKEYPKNHFVPVYWMATEDHDFEEINHFHLYGKKMHWQRQSQGAVGALSTTGLEEMLTELEAAFGPGDRGRNMVTLFKKAYTRHSNLADATRYLANRLFGRFGLVIVDGNDPELKENFIPYAEKELLEKTGFHQISETTKRLTDIGYGEQVHPREINLFYLRENLRERIVEQDGRFFINNTDLEFSREEILEELRNHPERFSPNALLRPLYQEVILPNLCYIGGGGELAYWFQLKDYFEAVGVPFPILLLRNSALVVPHSLAGKMKKAGVDIKQLFLPQHELVTKYTYKNSKIKIDFSKQKKHLQKQFKDLYKLAEKTDASFLGAVGAQEKKQLNGLDNLEKRLLKAQKRKLSEELDRIRQIQDELFPNQSLQERHHNFSEFYIESGDELMDIVKENLNPLKPEFIIFEL